LAEARVVHGAATVTGALAHGVRVRALHVHRDDRGALFEAFRQSWKGGRVPVQWNVVTSEPGVMRGVHVHLACDEAYVLLRGRLVVGYRDVRAGSPTEGAVALVEVTGERPALVLVPSGIAHGLAFLEPSMLLIGVPSYWDLANEVGCHWRDPALEIPWPAADLRASPRDEALPPLREVLPRIPPFDAAA
jgi:dTDP-4-dehydrorhamnose 3,5-epimerase